MKIAIAGLGRLLAVGELVGPLVGPTSVGHGGLKPALQQGHGGLKPALHHPEKVCHQIHRAPRLAFPFMLRGEYEFHHQN